MNKYLFAIVLSVVVVLNIVSTLSLATHAISANTATQKNGYATIKVLESNTLDPVLNATVCIVETRHYESTNKYGYTNKITLPIVPNPNFDISLKRDWGEFTIIVYKPGYSTYVSFYNQVYASTTNVGLVCYLTPIINPTDPLVISSVQSPPQDYIEMLVSLYKK